MIDYDEIEQYISGEMQGEDVQRFEEKMLSDTDLAIEVELYLSLQQEGRIIESQAAEKAKLKATLQELNQQHFSQPAAAVIPVQSPAEDQSPETLQFPEEDEPHRAKVFSIRKALTWAASVAAVLALILLVRNFTAGKPNNQQLYAQYAQSEELIHERGTDANPLRHQADSLYNAQNYTAAIPPLEQIIAATGDTELDYKIALGFCYMENNDYDNAGKIFDAIANGPSEFANKARLYKALLLLKQDQKAACINQLKTIPSSSSDYKKARELLDQLK